MEEKPPRGSGLTIALIVVLTVLVLFVGMQYSFKHDLAPARLIRSLLAAEPEIALPEATPSPVAKQTPPAETDAGILTEPVYDLSFDAYLRETLVPEYGVLDRTAAESALAAGYDFAEGADTTGAVGLCSAHASDLAGDGESELIVLLIRQEGSSFPLEMHIFGMQDGAIKELPGSTAQLADLSGASSAQNDCVELVAMDGRYYILYHQYTQNDASFYDRYVAFDITGGKAEPVLDGVYAYDAGELLLVRVAPPWLGDDALAGAPTATDDATGLSGTVLYADAANAGGEAYASPYEDSFTALDAMLGPLLHIDRIVLVDPLFTDWTELAARLDGTLDADAETDGYDEWYDEEAYEADGASDAFDPESDLEQDADA